MRTARLAILFGLLVDGCRAHPRASGAYGAPLPLNEGETVSFEDGLEVRVEDVQAACQPPQVCVQRGEIQVTLRVTSAGTSREVELSEYQHTEESFGPYTFRYVSGGGEPRLTVGKGGDGAAVRPSASTPASASGASPSGSETPAPAASPSASAAGHRRLFGQYGAELTLDEGDTVTFEDGLGLRVVQIVDARCKPDVVCVWQGEIYVVLRVTNAGAPGDVRLGQFMAEEASLGAYTFRLRPEKVTPSEVALTVRKGLSEASASSGREH